MTEATSLTHLAALIVTTPFWISALLKATFFRAAVDEVRCMGLSPAPAIAAATIALQAAGSAMVVLNLWPLVGAAALAAFTLVATWLGHSFWRKPGGQRVQEAYGFVANIGLLGGLFAVGLLFHIR